MCIMEVRPGQRLSTIAQAMAHNTNTVRGDMDMLHELCLARGHNHVIEKLTAALSYLDGAYNEFLTIFSDELKHDLAHHGDTPDPEYHHHERTLGDIEGVPPEVGDAANASAHPHPHAHITHVDRVMLQQIGLDGNPEAEADCARAEHFETRTT